MSTTATTSVSATPFAVCSVDADWRPLTTSAASAASNWSVDNDDDDDGDAAAVETKKLLAPVVQLRGMLSEFEFYNGSLL